MQTFLVSPDFKKTAQILDPQRLRNQANECLMLINAVTIGNGWSNHPATVMWSDNIEALVEYTTIICEQIIINGWRTTVHEKIAHLRIADPEMPTWLGWPEFHISHRRNLLRKWPEYYGLLNWNLTPDDHYIWPKPGFDWRKYASPGDPRLDH